MNSSRPRYLTKSRFKLANECPTKLFYIGKRDVYADHSLEDEFLRALAEGGFQVGELAKAMFPVGVAVDALDYEQSLAITADLLEREDVVIFEPAFLWENLFVRVDVLVKRGSSIELIEVKAKSCDGPDEGQFFGKRGGILSDWKPYLEDVVFQHYVVSHAYPDWEITPFLMLVDKSATCPTDGLHQKFLLSRQANGRSVCRQTAPLTEPELGSGLLAKVAIPRTMKILSESACFGPEGTWTLGDWIEQLRSAYAADERIWASPTSGCRDCAFRGSEEDPSAGLRSGFQECWGRAFPQLKDNPAQPTVLEVWYSKRKDKWLGENRPLMMQLEKDDFDPTDRRPGAMDSKERQWLQVEKVKRGDQAHELRAGLRDEMKKWKFPLHFIDFETMSPAIPMHAGIRPYEVLAFQYSHHVVHGDGRVEHAGEYIEDRVGAFPNISFVRALREELRHDDGTIFRYSHHENTVLCSIRDQILREHKAIPDYADLIQFINAITQPRDRDDEGRSAGERNMVDLWEMVKRYYYDPQMRGSNSIKQVLPAVLNSSEYLRSKYSRPIYGAEKDIRSRNFRDMVWLQEQDGKIVDPYELLPTMFEGFSERDRAVLLSHDGGENGSSLNNGGAAMTTFARMQFTEMSQPEREHLRTLLLKYCELDTLAMVMLYEAWREWLGAAAR